MSFSNVAYYVTMLWMVWFVSVRWRTPVASPFTTNLCKVPKWEDNKYYIWKNIQICQHSSNTQNSILPVITAFHRVQCVLISPLPFWLPGYLGEVYRRSEQRCTFSGSTRSCRHKDSIEVNGDQRKVPAVCILFTMMHSKAITSLAGFAYQVIQAWYTFSMPDRLTGNGKAH